jgi:signal peptidase I
MQEGIFYPLKKVKSGKILNRMYRLKKAETTLKATWKTFERQKHLLSEDVKKLFEFNLLELKKAYLSKDRELAKKYAKEVEFLHKTYLKKNPIRNFFEFSFALLFALAVAILIRQSSFELYEIPTGSMRPTYKELDKLVVSKTQFGLNIPLTTSHLLFKPERVKRMGAFTFTGENMDIPHVKTNYFYIFPGYKQFVKRVCGLPQDTLYFYGGKIYGIDKYDVDISDKLQKDNLNYLEHIPFIQIEGKISTSSLPPKNDLFSYATIKQMNIPIAKMSVTSGKDVKVDSLLKEGQKNLDLHELYGMGGFAQARILPKHLIHKSLNTNLTSADYYLELTHHASIKKAKIGRDHYFRQRPIASNEKSYIPLTETHLRRIFDNLVTGRFISENNFLRRYSSSQEQAKKNPYTPKIKDGKIPDGTYEFYNGKLYEVKTQGLLSEVKGENPLKAYDAMKAQMLFNAGIECDLRFNPTNRDHGILPSRYAYYRDGDLYLMGAKILSKNDPTLEKFVSTELEKKNLDPSYTPFVDSGAPLNEDGSLNVQFIKTYGLKIPEKHYLALGDNHAMSSDSRDFGFVPEDNIRGVPAFKFWAPGSRFGFAHEGIYCPMTIPRILSWLLLILGYASYKFYCRKSIKKLSFNVHPKTKLSQ